MAVVRKLALVLFIAFLLLGCAGQNFVRPEPESLVLGKTSYNDIIQRFGSPYREGTTVTNGATLKAISYAYSSGAASLAGGITPARAMGLYFLDNALIGYEFTSSYANESTDFDDSKVGLIKKGETTRDSVIKLLGAAGGIYKYPLTANEYDRALVYLYSQTKGSAFNLMIYQKLLVVSYNKDGIVTDVKFSSSGQK